MCLIVVFENLHTYTYLVVCSDACFYMGGTMGGGGGGGGDSRVICLIVMFKYLNTYTYLVVCSHACLYVFMQDFRMRVLV